MVIVRMHTVCKDDWWIFLEFAEAVDLPHHLNDWRMGWVVAEDQWLWWVTTNMMEQVQSCFEVWPSWHVHELAELANGEQLFTCCVGHPVEATGNLHESETAFLLQICQNLFGRGTVNF